MNHRVEEEFREDVGDFGGVSKGLTKQVRECMIYPRSTCDCDKQTALFSYKVLSGCRMENGQNGTAQKVGVYLSKLLLSKQEVMVMTTIAVTMWLERSQRTHAVAARENQQGGVYINCPLLAHFLPSSAPSTGNHFTRGHCGRHPPTLLSRIPPPSRSR